jgi:hypothetical protein
MGRNSKIQKYSKESSLLNVKIAYDGQKFEFNLYEELKIDEETIQRELKGQATSFSFLAMLHKRLIKKYKDAEKTMKTVWSSRYIYFKTSEKSEYFKKNHKQPADELCKAYVESDKEYLEAYTDFLKAMDHMNTIETCVKSFEQRKDLLQTLSANTRAENK